jgi:hypothetical protein
MGISLQAADPNLHYPLIANAGDTREVFGFSLGSYLKAAGRPKGCLATKSDREKTRVRDVVYSIRKVAVSIGDNLKDASKVTEDQLASCIKQLQELQVGFQELASKCPKLRPFSCPPLTEKTRRKRVRSFAYSLYRAAQFFLRHAVRSGYIPARAREVQKLQRVKQEENLTKSAELSSVLSEHKHLTEVEGNGDLCKLLLSRERNSIEFSAYSRKQSASHRLKKDILAGFCQKKGCDCRKFLQVGAGHGYHPGDRRGPYAKATSMSFKLVSELESEIDLVLFRLDEYLTSKICPSCLRRLKHKSAQKTSDGRDRPVSNQYAWCDCGVRGQRDTPSAVNQFDLAVAHLVFGRRPNHLCPGIRRPSLYYFRTGV